MNARLVSVLDKIKAASASTGRSVRLVAVSKTRPADDVMEAYALGQRHFGENYIAELYDKASNEKLLAACPDICWHFIGNFQSNKAKLLAKVPRLNTVETIHSTSAAKKLNDAWVNFHSEGGGDNILKVFIQVKTSEGEVTKSGCLSTQVVEIADFIRKNCLHLRLAGLMTIGNLQNSLQGNESKLNPDFAALVSCKELLCAHYENDELSRSLELSMGMSSDFELAIAMGSTNVRVGSLIFGQR